MENRNTLYKMTVTHIDCPKDWDSESDWDSHKPCLWLALKNTEGYVCELGSGMGSTPFLRLYCSENNIDFVSYETNKEWSEKTDSIFIEDYFKDTWAVGLLFVDCAPGEIRKDLIEKWKDDAQVIVAHDTEFGANYVYNMAAVLSTFKYRLDYQPKSKPHTTIVSNFINIEKWV